MEKDEKIELFIQELNKNSDLSLWQEQQIRRFLGQACFGKNPIITIMPKNHGRSLFSRRGR